MQQTKRFTALIAALLLCLSVFIIPASAKQTGEINSIRTNVIFDSKGSAHITEYWTANVSKDWSELYTVQPVPDINSDITDYTVKELGTNPVTYQALGSHWNIDQSRQQKANKYGYRLNKQNQIELCWGVGTPGKHTYQISYTITRAMRKYTDGNTGFILYLLDSHIKPKPKAVSLKISMTGKDGNVIPLSTQNSRIVSYGTKSPIVYTKNSYAELSAAKNFKFLNVVGCVDPVYYQSAGLLKTASTLSLDSNAAKDSSSALRNKLTMGDLICIFLSTIFLILCLDDVPRHSHKNQSISPLLIGDFPEHEKRNAPYSHEIPFRGSLEETWLVCQRFYKSLPHTTYLKALILRWLQTGAVTFIKRPSQKHKAFTIKLNDPPKDMTTTETLFWTYLLQESEKDGTIKSRVLKDGMKHSTEDLKTIYASLLTEGTDVGVKAGDFELEPNSEHPREVRPRLTEQGKQKTMEMLGFYRFLKDFTLVNERDVEEVKIWNDYLIYATLFDKAKQVAKQLKKVVPNYFEDAAYDKQDNLDITFDAVDLWFFETFTLFAAMDAAQSIAISPYLAMTNFSLDSLFDIVGGGAR